MCKVSALGFHQTFLLYVKYHIQLHDTFRDSYKSVISDLSLVLKMNADASWRLSCHYGVIRGPKVVLWYRRENEHGNPKFIWQATGEQSVVYSQAPTKEAPYYEKVDQESDTFSMYHTIAVKFRHFQTYQEKYFTCTVFDMDHLADRPKSKTGSMYPQRKLLIKVII